MKTLGLFEVKTRFSEVCNDVARLGEPVTVTRRGEPLVRIVPINRDDDGALSVWEARERYLATHEFGDEMPDVPREIDPVVNPFADER